jgi:hypothetical protein
VGIDSCRRRSVGRARIFSIVLVCSSGLRLVMLVRVRFVGMLLIMVRRVEMER